MPTKYPTRLQLLGAMKRTIRRLDAILAEWDGQPRHIKRRLSALAAMLRRTLNK